MSEIKNHPSSGLPTMGSLIPARQNRHEGQARPDLLAYPIGMDSLPALPFGNLDEKGVPYNAPACAIPAADHPTSSAQDALAYWNAYLASGESKHQEAFMARASWLLTHELRLSCDAGGWPLTCDYYAFRPWLSALAQGLATSVLVRAYQLTGEEQFLHAARRAVRTFELDILDGGINAPLGDDGTFFEEVAVYPASHILSGHIFALFALYDYTALTGDTQVAALIQRGNTALHRLLDAFDTGYWTRHDLLHKHLASRFHHSLHATMLEALAIYSGCEHCTALAACWAGYQHRLGSRLHYLVASRCGAFYSRLQSKLRRLIFRTRDTAGQAPPIRVCVPITGFPIAGGVRSVLAGVAQVMEDQWQMAYLTRRKGQDAEGLEIEVFGNKSAHPWQFPGVWLYCLAGGRKLLRLLRHGSRYDLILPQDGVFTGAFAALVGKLAGVRVVCMDHGNVTRLDNPAFRMEAMQELAIYPWHLRMLFRILYACYWPSQRLLAGIATRCADHLLVAGDEVEAAYRKLPGAHPGRIIRYAYMVDITRFTPPGAEARARMRTERGIPADAIVITMINRLASEKGLPFALEGVALALSALPAAIKTRIRVLIAGDGPLRSQIEADIQRHGLDSICTLWGEANSSHVVILLGMSDIFLYSGTRGTNYSMAVLEAMAAGCAVIASTSPQSNARLLAEGRGIAISPGNAAEIGTALVRLCRDPALSHRMGQLAREYVATYHTAPVLKRSLLRASFFAPSITGGDDGACN